MGQACHTHPHRAEGSSWEEKKTLQNVVDIIENSVFKTHQGSCKYELTMIVRAYTKPVQTSARQNTNKKSEKGTVNTSLAKELLAPDSFWECHFSLTT